MCRGRLGIISQLASGSLRLQLLGADASGCDGDWVVGKDGSAGDAVVKESLGSMLVEENVERMSDGRADSTFEA